MKTKILLFTIFMTRILTSFGQITTQVFSLTVPCCADSDSVDIGNNGIYDIQVKALFYFDAVNINDMSLHSNLNVTNNPVDSGTAFTFYNPYGGIIAQTSILCSWNSVWYPNSGAKYKGFRIVNSPGDTTFGWIKYNFVGDGSSCSDTVYGLELAYCNISNVHIFAGQSLVTGVLELTRLNNLEVNPTVAHDKIEIINHSNSRDRISIFSSAGQLKRILNISSTETILLDISDLRAGVYFLYTSEANNRIRIVKL
jgi:hypothetical protein